MKYRVHGKEKTLAFGTADDISLAEAREMRTAARKQITRGVDPNEAKRAAEAEAKAASKNSFEAIAREWHEHMRPRWSVSHGTKVLQSLEKDVFPRLASVRSPRFLPPEVLEMIRPIEERGAWTTTNVYYSA